ncbi:MAG: bifunctional diaminohydroxyphosphoribosylaminopyrimidine deaminase/5-amino-6-(5-phosphoribosylamino)uracil reductase RibD, partial [Gammaproteobacteria bacterium]|nr:bifunctional diaminohydroxyphosphoribosylaminopyrimidine deaminase/5-amino-6-(5-phosphoribosylamino)uracil reductase RibD [Gammaproteobacteria bacterium]
ARALNAGFVKWATTGRPFVTLKAAVTLDGRIATASGDARWVTGERARAAVHRLRDAAGAILVGAGTVRADDPRLDVRLDYGEPVRQPLRVVLDPALSCAPDAKVFAGGGALVFAAGDALGGARGEREGVRIEALPRDAHGLDLGAALARLAELEVNELLVECGPRLAAAWFRAKLVDELIVYVAPVLLGSDAPPLAELASAAGGPAAEGFEFVDVRRIGEDVRLILQPKEENRPCSPES